MARWLGISLLIASVVRVPLPQADYHNIRHHDAPGEICIYHDHLLRWHPSARNNDDIALLHWHWLMPLAELDDSGQERGDNGPSNESGPALHAHIGDLPEPDWLDQPAIGPDVRGRFSNNLAASLTQSVPADCASYFSARLTAPQFLLAFDRVPCAGMRADRIALLQRWNC
jgi:hypothetical protein